MTRVPHISTAGAGDWVELTPGEPQAAGGPLRSEGTFALTEPMQLGYLAWVCRCRWIVAGILTAYGLAGRVEGLLGRLGLVEPADWALACAGVLVVLNVAFLAHARRLRRREDYHQIVPSLWLQIVCDMLVLTAVVHFAGPLTTYIPFAYLFHIVLACIFFARPSSLLVALLACLLYSSLLAAWGTGLLDPHSLYQADLGVQIRRRPVVMLGNAVSAVCVWLVVWYMAMYLSQKVRRRDAELARTNRRLLQAQREKTRHMLRTTHELKGPLATIHANVQLLHKGYGGSLTPHGSDIVRRIAARCRSLSQEIQEMLQLANLRSDQQRPDPARLDLADVMGWCARQVREAASEQPVRIDEDLRPAWIVAPEDHVKMLLMNLLSNAVTYSRAGGAVRVSCGGDDGGRAWARIEDDGIGIAPEHLRRVFDEYYRTPQAVEHNKLSSGLGLAIVREVAQAWSIRVRLASRAGVGTRVELLFPPPDGAAQMEGDALWPTW